MRDVGMIASVSPRVSIIMPVYNACRSNPRYLQEAMQSIASQTVQDLEFIIVDDGSTDASADLIDAFIEAHPQLRAAHYRKDNGGQSSARNDGARRSSGAYLCFIDQDDLWRPNRLELIYPLLDGTVDVVYTDCDRIGEDGTVLAHEIHRTLACGVPHPKRSIDDILYKDIFVMPGLMAIKRSVYDEVGGFDERLSGYEDDDIFLRLFPVSRMVYLSAATLGWRKYGDNYSFSERMINSRERYWRKLVDQYAGDRRRQGRITLRFFRESLIQAVTQYDAGDPQAVRSLRSARLMLPELPSAYKAVFQPVFLLQDQAALEFIHGSYAQYRRAKDVVRR